mgnify:CR=1 FL=1
MDCCHGKQPGIKDREETLTKHDEKWHRKQQNPTIIWPVELVYVKLLQGIMAVKVV